MQLLRQYRYQLHQILDENEDKYLVIGKLCLILAVSHILKDGLELLGIDVLEEM